MDLVIASNNAHKVKEIKNILGDKFGKIYTLRDLGINVDVEENGRTFYENALKKAKAISDIAHMAAIADDSGLEVDSLGGAPGLYSARYAGLHGDDNANNKQLLDNLKNKESRRANFICTVVLYLPDGDIISAEGKSYGTIIDAPRGENGFGYDPLFLSDEYSLTYAELSQDQKNSISHRAKALNTLAQILNEKQL